MSKLLDFFMHRDRDLRDNRWIFGMMLAGALLSLLASFVLSNETIELARNPNVALSCSINEIVNCASVAKHPSSEMFGFPNSFLGLIAEPVVITVAIAGLAGVKFPRLFMFVAQLFYTLGFVFALILLYISMFIIQALCPWCLLVTLTTTLVWFAITRYNIRENNLYLSKKAHMAAKHFIDKGYDRLIMVASIVVLAAGIILKYGGDLFA